MAAKHHVVLIPGFFGFANLGELRYFLGVEQQLERYLGELGIDAKVHEVVTLPTSSIRHRAARVLEVLEEVSGEDDGPVHLVGHSTGGLDARLAVTPTASLPTEYDTLDAFQRVKSLVTVSAPHHGTPLASYYGSAMGKPLLQLLAVATVYILRYGRLPLGAAIKLGGLFVKADDFVGLSDTVADQLYNELLADFTEERREAVVKFLNDVSADQSLVFQLTPSALDLFNATTADPKGIRYGSVVTRARPPRLRQVLNQGYDPYAHSMYLVYTGLWMVAARSNEDNLPQLTTDQWEALRRGYGWLPEIQDNDGIVPTHSQVWGRVIHTARGDHLDVVGHYGQTRKVDSVYADWIPTGSGFDNASFDAAWWDIATFIAEAAREGR
jgi:triacylglycerol esterase/lipase EstA (alpha/beta hydrolase family)